MYTLSELHEIRNQAWETGLSAPKSFWHRSLVKLQMICNGCGSESMPEWSREVLTWLYRNYAGAHCIHDYRYEYSDGTEINRCAADREFNENCIKLWERKYGWSRWINPVALYGRNKIRLAYKALYYNSRDAWLAAYEKRKSKEEKR